MLPADAHANARLNRGPAKQRGSVCSEAAAAESFARHSSESYTLDMAQAGAVAAALASHRRLNGLSCTPWSAAPVVCFSHASREDGTLSRGEYQREFIDCLTSELPQECYQALCVD